MITGKYKIHIVLPDGTTKDWDSFNKIEKRQIAENITNQAMAARRSHFCLRNSYAVVG